MADATILYGGTVHTMDTSHPLAGGLRFAGPHITHVFDGPPPRELSGERIDLQGAVVLPGLVDTHFHLRSLGAMLGGLPLQDAESLQAALELVREAVARAPVGALIEGRGYDETRWVGAPQLHRRLLDEVAPRNPVLLTRVDGHAAWVNSRLLELAGMDAATDDPQGGRIVRDASGELSGVLIDLAIDRAKEHLPARLDEELRSDYTRGIDHCMSLGLTGVHEIQLTPPELEQLLALEEAGALNLRITCYLYGSESELAPYLAEGPRRGGLVRVQGIKLFADGALGSHGAALLEPYSDQPETSGLVLTPPEELRARASSAQAAGFQVAVHAIGDRANRMALDTFESLWTGQPRTPPHRIEHAQIIHSHDIPRFGRLGIAACVQPIHLLGDLHWASGRLGKARLKRAYPWRNLLNAGVLLPLGSDAPVEDANPWVGVRAAVTRQTAGGKPPGGWFGEQRLTLSEALAGYTTWAARLAGDEDLGRIAKGSRADLTVVDRDPYAIEPGALDQVTTERTIVEGRTIFEVR